MKPRITNIDVFRHYQTDEHRLVIDYADGTCFEAAGPDLRALFLAAGMTPQRASMEAARYA